MVRLCHGRNVMIWWHKISISLEIHNQLLVVNSCNIWQTRGITFNLHSPQEVFLFRRWVQLCLHLVQKIKSDHLVQETFHHSTLNPCLISNIKSTLQREALTWRTLDSPLFTGLGSTILRSRWYTWRVICEQKTHLDKPHVCGLRYLILEVITIEQPWWLHCHGSQKRALSELWFAIAQIHLWFNHYPKHHNHHNNQEPDPGHCQ